MTMSRSAFRPQLESLDERALPSGNPALSISDVSLVGGISGQTAFEFTVSLSHPSKQPVSVKYATADGTATAAEGDYAPTSGTLTFAKGQTAATITVLVNGSSVAEPDETFLVKLGKPSRATIADGTGVGTIQEPLPSAFNDSNSTYQDRATSGNVLWNDYDSAGAGLKVGTVNGSAASVGNTIHLPSGALLTVNIDGSYTYNPNGAFNLAAGQAATDGFTYTATDALGTPTNTATVTLTIRPVAPTAVNDSYETPLNATTATGENVLANDLDPVGGGLAVTAVNGSAASVGTTTQLASGALVTVSADGSFWYDPNGAFDSLAGTGGMAIDGFTYTVTDSRGNQSTATVTISISDPYYWDPNGPNTGPYPIH
jgi:VCBS repeat-containing protein